MPAFDTGERIVGVGLLTLLYAGTVALAWKYSQESWGLPDGIGLLLGFPVSTLFILPIVAIATKRSRFERQDTPVRVMLMLTASVLINVLVWLLLWAARTRLG